MSDLKGIVCLVTGATQGIGRATAEALARMGATVIVHGRNPDAVESACEEIRHASQAATVSGAVADFGSLAAVRHLAAEIARRQERLDVLINNAGTAALRRKTTVDGFEWQLQVNHLAPFLLTNRLRDLLEASAPSRIVTVSSMAYRRGGLELDDLNWEHRKYNGLEAYGASKLANILFTLELARRLAGTGVTANCLHPGVVATNIFSNMGLLGKAFSLLARRRMLAPAAGAKTSIYLATSPEVANVSGKFFNKCAEAELAPGARNPDLARRLWERSAAMIA